MKKEVKNNTFSIVIDGMEIRTKEQLLTTMKDALSFPDFFGMNWDALDDLLHDLSWLEDVESVEIVFTNSDQILSADTYNNKAVFQRIMDSAVEYWKMMKDGIIFFVDYKDQVHTV